MYFMMLQADRVVCPYKGFVWMGGQNRPPIFSDVT